MAAKQDTRPELTDKQRDVLNFIKKSIRTNGIPPTMQEIADEFGFSSSTGAIGHLTALERKGYIERVTEKSRAIRIVE